MSVSKHDLKISRLSFSYRIARRYLFSKKSHNAINIVSAISATGVAIGTLALVVVMSVLNGFESVISDMFSAIDPDLRITLSEGKGFDISTDEFEQLRKMPEVAVFTEVVEENALLLFNKKQMPASIKGVSDNFIELNNIDSIIYDGEFVLFDGAFERAVPGIGVASNLGLGAHFIDPLEIYAPKRTSKINLLRPESSFNKAGTFVSGIFAVNQVEYDDEMVIVSIALARELFEYDDTMVSSIEMKIDSKADFEKTQKQIQNLLGPNFQVKNRYEQQESFFKILKIEKWITFLILSFILLIASFNIIGSLSMLIIDKKNDINTLKSLGADKVLIKRIFLFEGWMIAAVGAVAGIVLGSAVCLIQEYFEVFKLGPNSVIDAYPVVLNFSDMIVVFFTVLFMGLLAAWYPVRYIGSKKSDILND